MLEPEQISQGIILALSEIQKKKVDSVLTLYCEEKVPAHVRDQVRLSYESRGNFVTLFEDRPVWNDPTAEWTHMKVAQFRFDDESLNWNLYCCDRNQKWHKYQGLSPSSRFEDLIDEVDDDPTGIFWG